MRMRCPPDSKCVSHVDSIFFELFRMFFGTLVFFGIYFLQFEDTGNFWSNLQIIVVYNMFASFMAAVISYICIWVLFYKQKRYVPKGIMEVLPLVSMDRIGYEIIILIINSMVGALLVMNYLLEYSQYNVAIFMIYWMMYKVVISAFAYVISNSIKNRIVIVLILAVILGGIML